MNKFTKWLSRPPYTFRNAVLTGLILALVSFAAVLLIFGPLFFAGATFLYGMYHEKLGMKTIFGYIVGAMIPTIPFAYAMISLGVGFGGFTLEESLYIAGIVYGLSIIGALALIGFGVLVRRVVGRIFKKKVDVSQKVNEKVFVKNVNWHRIVLIVIVSFISLGFAFIYAYYLISEQYS